LQHTLFKTRRPLCDTARHRTHYVSNDSVEFIEIFAPLRRQGPFLIRQWQLSTVVLHVTPVRPLAIAITEYNLLLAQRITSYPLVLVGLSCGCSSFARVTNELPISRTVVTTRPGHIFSRSTAQLSCPNLSLFQLSFWRANPPLP
jgi:hypothetical protein